MPWVEEPVMVAPDVVGRIDPVDRAAAEREPVP